MWCLCMCKACAYASYNSSNDITKGRVGFVRYQLVQRKIIKWAENKLIFLSKSHAWSSQDLLINNAGTQTDGHAHIGIGIESTKSQPKFIIAFWIHSLYWLAKVQFIELPIAAYSFKWQVDRPVWWMGEWASERASEWVRVMCAHKCMSRKVFFSSIWLSCASSPTTTTAAGTDIQVKCIHSVLKNNRTLLTAVAMVAAKHINYVFAVIHHVSQFVCLHRQHTNDDNTKAHTHKVAIRIQVCNFVALT